MSENKIIALLSDFGLQDVYVGVMKGVIARINPQLQVVDLTHQLPPQNIAAARFCLLDAYRYFPVGTVYVAVVDPGVGSQRRAVAVEFAEGYLVAPDNGLLCGVLAESPAITAVELTNSQYWLSSQPSSTFHGRDIFAPVGAYLGSGVSIAKLGEKINPSTLVQWENPPYQPTEAGFAGYIQYVDVFGNLITNIPGEMVAGKSWSVAIADLIILGSQTYSDTEVGSIVALVGSHGWVEIAVNGGSAKSKLQLDWGGLVEVIIK
ncbi:SAM hydrolase/SAM-dependent halogenase family protein [Oscillatoria salina]|uniref:SAM hydrolase/SAM-dependent halogenase family protein n=1 Tax=Oscillatoria salina TaxID=331517 RepID=UPI0013B5BE1C|nr:SAM-dependent chlorinase/fluorinase [Oscillatoria salina]MBZ8181019.1 SAM-dependent chlorinase/fluorinase [Oscillatoria salina IIICB1]NET88140.1 SAM-dependent chlorinase/fluorinase [Kamptonema sp. SIO1D9]